MTAFYNYLHRNRAVCITINAKLVAVFNNTAFVPTPREKVAIARNARRPGWSQASLAEELADRGFLGRSKTEWDARIKNIENNRGRVPSDVELFAIAEVLGIVPGWMTTEDDAPVPFADTLGNAAVVRFPTGQPLTLVPYWGEVPCGNWEKPEPGDDALIEVSHRVSPKGVIAVRVRGNSMLPRFGHGQIVVVKIDPQPLDGVITLARNADNELTLKMLRRKNGSWTLCSLNPEYGDCTAESWTILGHAVHVEESDPAGLRA